MNFKELIRKDNIEKLLQGRGFRLRADNLYFSVYSNEFNVDGEEFYLLYLFDETELRLIEKEFIDTRPCIMLTVLDNADEVYNNFKESDCAAIFTKTEQMIEQWVSSYGGLCRKYSSSRMMDFIEEHEYIYDKKAPYEISCNKYISSEELKYIHTIEHSLEYYYNNSTKYNRQRLKKSFQYS